MVRWRVAVVVAALGLFACRDRSGLVGASGPLSASPETLEFPPAYANAQTLERDVLLLNAGRTPQRMRWLDVPEPFSAELPSEIPPGETRVTVRFAPKTASAHLGTLDGKSDEGFQLVIKLEGYARDIPACPMPDSCHQQTFDVATETCIDTVLADGTQCDPHSVCITQATCQAGRCVGPEKTCDDNNKCTVDSCNAVTGCEFAPAAPCPGDGKCQVGVCNPATGCGLAPASDGTACGPLQTCDAAEVCVSGSCVVRDPPNGYVCAQASPCQGEGRCSESTCMRPPASTIGTSWNFDSQSTANPDAGLAADQLHDFVLEPSGAITLLGFFQTAPLLRANTEQALDAPLGGARRCVLWNGRLVCADYPAAVNGKVTALDLATGAAAWSFDFRAARPDLTALTNTVFLARLAALGSDRFAALYEAYPKSTGAANATDCRLYFLVVLDAAGKLVTAQQVKDPVLEQCNHPHPYGFVADTSGQLYISFSPTDSDVAPLKPGTPTMVTSYSRDGIYRWKFTDFALVGGELATAQGLLYPENSPIAVRTTNGTAAFALDHDFGRAVVTRQRLLPAPTAGATSIPVYEAGTNTRRALHQLPPGQSFSSDQIRLAQWTTRNGPRTVALTFTTNGFSTFLHAVDAREGAAAFTCPVATGPVRSPPQLFEVANGSLAFMEGASTCGKCDPPYAQSSAAFHTLPVPFLSQTLDEPWVGTFGGAGHDHREETLMLAPSTAQSLTGP